MPTLIQLIIQAVPCIWSDILGMDRLSACRGGLCPTKGPSALESTLPNM